MNDRVIEPSEIIIDREGLPKEDTSHVNPWIRFLARFFDYSLFFLLLWGIRTVAGGQFPLGRFEHLIPFEFFVWIPIEALLLSTWGTTPGKFFLRTELKQGRKTRLDYFTALKRSFNVWFRGLGLGIPIVIFLCLLVAYHRLRVFRQTSWDREENIIVLHYPIGRWRIAAAAIIATGGLLFYYHAKNQDLKTARHGAAPLQNSSLIAVESDELMLCGQSLSQDRTSLKFPKRVKC